MTKEITALVRSLLLARLQEVRAELILAATDLPVHLWDIPPCLQDIEQNAANG